MLLRFGFLILLLGVSACQDSHAPAPDPNVDPEVSATNDRGAGPITALDGVSRWRASVNGTAVRVRVARTRSERYAGLSGVKLDSDEGMFFMYETKTVLGYWMKGCIVGLDIAWLTDDLKVLKVDTLAAPGSKTTDATMPRASAPEPVRYVLEMPAGWFARHGMGVGARVSVPAKLLRKKVD
jgi:uncharacterized membrane protein (UPF0127 family)